MHKMCIAIYGLPGAGKTELARRLNAKWRCPWFNADRVRKTLCKDLGFSEMDRLEQARRLGALGALALDASPVALIDFVNPLERGHIAFLLAFEQALNIPGDIFTVFMDTITPEESRFSDTSAMFVRDREYGPNLVVTKFLTEETQWARLIEEIEEQVRLCVSQETLPTHQRVFDGNATRTGPKLKRLKV